MGNMVDGVWHADGLFKSDEKGGFKRPDSGFRDWITADGEAGPEGQTGHRAEAGRYHLYVSYACPWAHRTMILRALKGLEPMIGLSVVDPLMRDDGWTFATEHGGTGDALHGSDFLWQLYARARDGYTGKVTVPVLWDTGRNTIVSNESADIIRMLNTAFDRLGAREGDYYPAALRGEIDAVNATVYDRVNNGVYKCGFAKTQEAYDAAIVPLFAELDRLEKRLSRREWLVGDQMTEADIRLFTTLVRFDAVYHGHFKCNVRRVQDYPALEGLLERMLAIPAIAKTVHLDHIKTHYYASHLELNPTGIVPAGPDLPWAGLVRSS